MQHGLDLRQLAGQISFHGLQAFGHGRRRQQPQCRQAADALRGDGAALLHGGFQPLFGNVFHGGRLLHIVFAGSLHLLFVIFGILCLKRSAGCFHFVGQHFARRQRSGRQHFAQPARSAFVAAHRQLLHQLRRFLRLLRRAQTACQTVGPIQQRRIIALLGLLLYKCHDLLRFLLVHTVFVQQRLMHVRQRLAVVVRQRPLVQHRRKVRQTQLCIALGAFGMGNRFVVRHLADTVLDVCFGRCVAHDKNHFETIRKRRLAVPKQGLLLIKFREYYSFQSIALCHKSRLQTFENPVFGTFFPIRPNSGFQNLCSVFQFQRRRQKRQPRHHAIHIQAVARAIGFFQIRTSHA